MALDHIIAAATITAALAAGAMALQPETPPAVPPTSAVAISSTALPLNADDPGQTSVGALHFLGALHLRSSNRFFGGISGLRAGAATPDGVRLLGVTDSGNWLSLVTVERGGRLVGVRDSHLVPIRGVDGKLAPTKAAGDGEALEWQHETGIATIVYEQDHRFVHFTGIDAGQPASLATHATRIERLTAMTGWPPNGGGEAMADLPGGPRIVISERRERPDGSHVALISHDGITRDIAIAGVPDHSPTDAVAIDATRVLVLHRRFDLSGQGAALSLVDLAPALAGTPEAPLPALLLARWQAPVTLDNMEGLALHRVGERLFVYIASDNNFSSLQRTVLMKFELKLPAQPAPAPNENGPG